MNKQKAANCTLAKVKLINGGGIEVHYKETIRDGDMQFIDEHIKKSTVNPHPDLTQCMERLTDYLLRCYNVTSIDVVRKSNDLTIKEKDAFKAVKKLIDAMIAENKKKTEISGVSITGEEGKQAVVITGKQLQANKSKTALNSPRIKLNQDTFGFESDIEQIIIELDEEVKLYLFDGKKAQLDLFDDEPTLSDDFVDGNIGKEEPAEEAA